jgi:hypothetical protein
MGEFFVAVNKFHDSKLTVRLVFLFITFFLYIFRAIKLNLIMVLRQYEL